MGNSVLGFWTQGQEPSGSSVLLLTGAGEPLVLAQEQMLFVAKGKAANTDNSFLLSFVFKKL